MLGINQPLQPSRPNLARLWLEGLAETLVREDGAPGEIPLQRQAELREIIWAAKLAGKITPDAVAAYAELHLRTEEGKPIIPAAHHRLWLELLCDERIKRLAIVAPPSSAKTTWIISAYAGCSIGIFPEWPIIICSSSGDTAGKRSMALRAMIENESWRATFPNLQRARNMKWDLLEWSIAPYGRPHPGRLHPTVSAYGVDGSITGSRAKLLICDDLHDFKNSRTAHQRELIKATFHNTIIPRLMPGGLMRIIGTRWENDDYLATIQDAPDPDWVVCHVPILADGPEVYADITYPEGWRYGPIAGAIPMAQAEVRKD